MKKRGLLIFSLMFAVLLISLAVGDFDDKNREVIKFYSTGEIIKGTINISFDEEPASSLLTSNFKGNITLLEFLEKNYYEGGVDFECSTAYCLDSFTAGSKTTQVNVDEDKFVGFKLVGDNVRKISSVKMDIASNIETSCFKQLDVDIGNDGENVLTNNKYVDSACFEKDYGCFDLGLSEYNTAIIPDTPLCEKITLNSAPAYKVGAKIQNSSNIEGEIEMELRDAEENSIVLGSCILPKHSQNNEELECVISYLSSEEKDFFVCVVSKDYEDNLEPDYKIRVETSGEKCGTDDYGDKLNKDFEIFARGMKFNKLDLQINDTMFEFTYGYTLSEYIEDYLYDTYEMNEDGVNCENECIVPIKFSGREQTLYLSNTKIGYYDGNTPFVSDKVYLINVDSPKISSDFLKLKLEEANFTIPVGSTEKKFKFYIGGEKVFEEAINLSTTFDFDLTPKFAMIGQNTLFRTVTSKNITSSVWDFGDEGTYTSNNKEAVHRYIEEGDFEISVSLTDKDGKKSSKKFIVGVGDAKKSANLTIIKYENRLVNLTKELGAFAQWKSREIEKVVNPSELSAEVSRLKAEYGSAVGDDEFLDVVLALVELDVPYSVSARESGTLPILVGDYIDVSYIEEVSGKDASDPDELEDIIVGWMGKNYDSDVDYEKIAGYYDGGVEDIITSFKFNLNKKTSSDVDSYLFIDLPIDEINFKESYGEKAVSGGAATYIPSSGSKTIEFSLSGEVGVEDLGAYVAPEISQLVVTSSEEIIPFDIKNPFKTGGFVFWISVLAVAFLIVYIILQEWYKRNYENHLFSNRNDLYNLINFIYNGRKSGLGDSEINKKLSSSGWSGEKRSYAFRKIDGKRTGMLEIPLFRFFERKKVKDEIAKRQGREIDTRFIKGPRF